MRNFPKFIFTLNFLYIILIAAETVAIIFFCLYLPAFISVAATFAGIWVVSVIAAVTVVYRSGAPEMKCALLLFITAVPVAGALIYFLSGLRRKKCGSLLVENARPLQGLEAAAYDCCGVSGVGYDSALYFSSGEEYFNNLFRQIERAQNTVYLEYYILCRGKIFDRLLSALRAAKSNGAEIKILIDGIGSAFKAGRRELKKLKMLGAEVRIFRRLVPLVYTRLNNRDHRKIAAIDGKAAFIGGFNLADEYANVNSPFGYWKDTGVALFGAAAKVYEGMFLSVWNNGHKMPFPEGGKFRCLPYYDSPPDRAGFCEDAYVAAISSAKERVHIFTPYFCAGERTSAALAFAAMRGVDVRIIIPHIPDKKYAFTLSKISAVPLAAKGVKFYEYIPGFMHAKSMVCDDSLFIGSYNFDFRSMRINYECGVMLGGEICDKAERDFWESLRLSAPLRHTRPSVFGKMYRFIIKLFAPLM